MKRWLIVPLLLSTMGVAHAVDQGYTNFKSSVTFTGTPIYLSSSPAVISSSKNNYDWGLRPVVRSSATASINITGFIRARDGVSFTLVNVSTNTITIVNASSLSTVGNRIATDTGSNVAISSGDSRSFWYDAITSVWRIIR